MSDSAAVVSIGRNNKRRRSERSDEPSHNREAEQFVLGALLLDNTAIARARAHVDVQHFFDHRHRLTFGAMVRLFERGEPIELVTLKEELDRSGDLDDAGGPAYIASLIDGMPRAGNVEHYARIVRRRADERALSYACITARAAIAENPDQGAPAIAELRARLDALDESLIIADIITESLPDIIARLAGTDSRRPVLGDLIALGEIAMIHGQPRDGKTWVSLELTSALALGGRAFGLERLSADRVCRVLVCNNEDSPAQVVERLRRLLAGRGVIAPPDTIHLLVGRGVNLDETAWHATILSEIKRLAIDVLILDPLRSLTACVDQGPNELRPFALLLRRIVRETGVAIVLVHHDVKPATGITDTRRRAQRASGGALFSIVDAPIHVERVDDRRSLVAPDGFKFIADPSPFVFERIEREDAVLLIADDVTATTSAADVAIQGRIREYLRENPGQSGTAITKALRARKQAVCDALDELARADIVDSVDGPRGARLWMLH